MRGKFFRFISRAAVVLVALELLVLVFGPPQFVEHWLSCAGTSPNPHPRYIVVLGGGGIPSDTSLTRCYYAAQFGRGMTNTTFVVALPTNGDPETSNVGKMRDELVLRGIPAVDIRLEYRGLNTRQQAASVGMLLGATAKNEPVVVVTSHLHMRRALMCFRKAGFTNVTGLVAQEHWAEAPSGPWSWFRYKAWNNGVNSIQILRELVAVTVCKLT